MKKLLLMMTLTGAAAVYVGAQSLDVELQRVTQKEIVTGDLKAAIEEYKDIVDRAGSNKKVAAQALIRMAGCYEKLGTAEAQKIYERVVRDYADQKEVVAEAQARLASISDAANKTGDDSRTRVRLVWSDGERSGSVSPDGRYLTFRSWNPGRLALRDLRSGDVTFLTDPVSGKTGYPGTSAISPDGKWVAYAWNLDDGQDMRVVGIDGKGSRIVYGRNPEVSYLMPRGWSHDMKKVLVVIGRKDGTVQIGWAPIDGGSVEILKSLDGPVGHPMVSGDGRYIAYDAAPERDIFILAADGSRETPLVEHPANDRVLGWTRDEDRVVFVSDRSGADDVWTIPVSDGKPIGGPMLAHKGFGGDRPLGLTADGSLYYGVSDSARDVYVTSLDLATGRLPEPRIPTAQRNVGSNFWPAWSRDGRRLAYISRFGATDSNLVIVRDTKTGEERQLKLTKYLFYAADVQWSPDGRWLLVTAYGDHRGTGVFRIDAMSGETEPIVLSKWGSFGILDAIWGQDNNHIYYIRRGEHFNSQRRSIIMRSLDDGVDREIYSNAGLFPWDLSPDGKTLALLVNERENRRSVVRLVAADGGKIRDLHVIRGSQEIQGVTLEWSSDGRYLFFTQTGALWKVPVAGGAPEKVQELSHQIFRLVLHPDGSQVAYSTLTRGDKIWALENFLPKQTAGR